MATKKKEKVLIALDGSKRGLQAVVYASKLESLQEMEIKLYHVFDSIPANHWDLYVTNPVVGTMIGARVWETKRKQSIEKNTFEAEKLLINEGFFPENIEIKIKNREEDIARDIIKEASQGYKMVVIRRRGMGAIKDLIVGSVSTKILEVLKAVPILVVGQNPSGNKYLIAVDGSESSNRSLDFAADILKDHDSRICLIHVIRSGADSFAGDMPMPLFSNESFMKKAMDKSADILQKAKTRLVESGLDEHFIQTRTITGAFSRAAAITDEAQNHDYGTIIVGRKGLSSVKSFSMGRVTKKIIYRTVQNSVWIIP